MEEIVVGNVVVRPNGFLAYVDGRPLPLTMRDRRCERSVDVYVGKLRHKLDAAAPGWCYIHTHFGLGYRFDPQPRGD